MNVGTIKLRTSRYNPSTLLVALYFLIMMSNQLLDSDSPDDMYTGDEDPKNRSGRSSNMGTGKLIDSGKLNSMRDYHHRKEKRMEERIRSLEQELIKLQLQNSQLSANAANRG